MSKTSIIPTPAVREYLLAHAQELPLLGTGKLDLREVRRIAVEALA